MDKLWIIVILLPENTNMKNIKLMQVYRLLHINNTLLITFERWIFCQW